MPDQPHDLEPTLRGQRASGLDASLLNRLEAAADGSLLELTTLEIQFEQELRKISPSPLPASLLDSLADTAAQHPFPAPETVVPFNKQSSATPNKNDRSWWSAAAAVALFGAMAALMFPDQSNQTTGPLAHQPSISTPDDQSPPIPATEAPGMVPASFSRELYKTTDQGVYWPENGEPHRVVKVVYMQQMSVKREDGSTYQFEQPVEEFYLVPTESD